MEFKDALRRRREALRLSPEELAYRLTRHGAPTASADVQLWERGRNTPPLDNPDFQRALAAALQTPIESIRRVIPLVERLPERSPEADRAAELVETLPAPVRLLALDLLATLARHSVPRTAAPAARDFWADD